MLKVTGILKYNGLLFENPEIRHTLHLAPLGGTTIDADIYTEGERRMSIGYEGIPAASFNDSTGNAYDFMISKVDEIVKDNLLGNQPELIINIL